MCPVVLLALLFSFLMLMLELTAALTVAFSQIGDFKEGENRTVYFNVRDTIASANESHYKILSDHPDIADAVQGTLVMNKENGTLNGSFVVVGKFLGITELRIVRETGKEIDLSNSLLVRISKVEETITKAFTYCVIILVSLNYINMGCALDFNVVMSVLKKPIAPSVGFFSQFVIMPLVAYGLARALFTDTVLQLGLFTFGCSPGGGASNMWTVLLKGNLNLSLTMTFISGLAAFAMMPLWLFTLGRTLFSGIKVAVPYQRILGTLCIMIVTLGIGVCFQKYQPRIAKFCKKILAPVSVVMILIIIVFGTYANLYMFRLFTWRIVIAATANVWLGFLFGAITSRVLQLSMEDTIAIAIETGVQNTGIAFFLLSFSLPTPERDLAAVIPVAASIMTPVPLLLVYIMQKLQGYMYRRSAKGQSYVLSDDDDAEKRALPTPSSTTESFGEIKMNGSFH